MSTRDLNLLVEKVRCDAMICPAGRSPSSPLSEVLLPRRLIVGGAVHDPEWSRACMGFAERKIWNFAEEIPGLLRLDIGRADHLAPLLGFVGEELAEVGGRSAVLPDIPTVGEFVPGYEASAFFGVGSPKNTPTEIADKLNMEINAGLADPKLKAQLADRQSTGGPIS